MNINDKKQQAVDNGVIVVLGRRLTAKRRRRQKYWQRVYAKLVLRTTDKEFRYILRNKGW